LKDVPVDSQAVAIGEIGLGGEIRTISQIEKRIAEAKKLGFKRMLIPKNNLKGIRVNGDVALIEVDTVEEAIRSAFDN
jgi:DNA repair protein RadA/Sms